SHSLFTAPSPPATYTLSLHDALPIYVEKAVAAQLKTLPRAAIACASWADFGAIIMVKNLNDAIPLADAIAAEHLEIMTQDPDARSEEHTSELQSRFDLVCRLLLEKKK